MRWFARWRWRVWSARAEAARAAVGVLREADQIFGVVSAVAKRARAERKVAYWRSRMQHVPRAEVVKHMRPYTSIYCPGYNAAFYDGCPHRCVGSFCKRASEGRGRQVHAETDT